MNNKIYVNNSIYATITKETNDVIILRTYACQGKFYINTVSMSVDEFKSKYREATSGETIRFCKNIYERCFR